MTSSWVGPKQNSRSWRSLIRSSSLPYCSQRPDSIHSDDGWIAGISSSTPPALFISARTIASSFAIVRSASGAYT